MPQRQSITSTRCLNIKEQVMAEGKREQSGAPSGRMQATQGTGGVVLNAHPGKRALPPIEKEESSPKSELSVPTAGGCLDDELNWRDMPINAHEPDFMQDD